MLNAMRANGTQINTLSPLFQTIMRAAPGLATAYLTQGALNNTQSSDQYADYGKFLANSLNAGNIPSLLRTAQGQIGDVVGQARAYLNAQQSGSPNPLAGNSMLAALAGQFGQGNGQGLVNAIEQLATPFMNARQSTAYQNLIGGPAGLASQANTALGNYFLGGGQDPRDFWYYLLGR